MPKLMLVTDRHRTRGRDLVDVVAEAVEGGVGIVQVREPDLPRDRVVSLVGRIREATGPDVTIVVNGNLEVARECGCGLHLPARVGPLASRGVRGQPFGRSAHDEIELERAVDDRVDYVIVGNVYRTDSKPGRPGAGVGLVERICRLSHPLPVFAIGGMTVTRIPGVIHSGAHGVAVCGALIGAKRPAEAAQAICLALDVAHRAGLSVHGSHRRHGA